MLADYRAAQARIDASTDRLFDIKPRRTTRSGPSRSSASAAPAAARTRRPALDGRRPGVFYLNTYEPRSRPRYDTGDAARARGVAGPPLPDLHRARARPAAAHAALRRVSRRIAEGWGLYAETLGPELGLYTDPVPVLRLPVVGAVARDPPGARHRHPREGLDAGAGDGVRAGATRRRATTASAPRSSASPPFPGRRWRTRSAR